MIQFLSQHHTLQENAPEWFKQRSQEACDLANQTAAPSLLDENWRFGSINNSSLDSYKLADKQDDDFAPIDEQALNVCYSNGYPTKLPSSLPTGLQIVELSDLIHSNPEQAQSILAEIPHSLGSEQLTLIHRAMQSHGIIIIAKQECQAQINIHHSIKGDDCVVFPSTIIIAEDYANITVKETWQSEDAGNQFAVGMLQISAKQGASIDYALKQDLNIQSQSVQIQDLRAYDHACINHVTAQKGTKWTRQETFASMLAEEAQIKLYSANFVANTTKLDQRTKQWHAKPGASSNLIYKNVLNDRAKTIFSGMILVDQGAHQTSAYQSNRNLLLNDQAEANSMPGLEILADGVQCSHGSATSSLSNEEIFYLLSRGIPEDKARHMIAQGFLKQSLNDLHNDNIVNFIFPEEV